MVNPNFILVSEGEKPTSWMLTSIQLGVEVPTMAKLLLGFQKANEDAEVEGRNAFKPAAKSWIISPEGHLAVYDVKTETYELPKDRNTKAVQYTVTYI